jgi:hypothetical protein
MKSLDECLDIITQATIVLNSAHKYSARQRQHHATRLGYVFEHIKHIQNTAPAKWKRKAK